MHLRIVENDKKYLDRPLEKLSKTTLQYMTYHIALVLKLIAKLIITYSSKLLRKFREVAFKASDILKIYIAGFKR